MSELSTLAIRHNKASRCGFSRWLALSAVSGDDKFGQAGGAVPVTRRQWAPKWPARCHYEVHVQGRGPGRTGSDRPGRAGTGDSTGTHGAQTGRCLYMLTADAEC